MLWLGANVMLEYDATEAQTLLTNNKENAVKSLEDVREQLGKNTIIFHSNDEST